MAEANLELEVLLTANPKPVELVLKGLVRTSNATATLISKDLSRAFAGRPIQPPDLTLVDQAIEQTEREAAELRAALLKPIKLRVDGDEAEEEIQEVIEEYEAWHRRSVGAVTNQTSRALTTARVFAGNMLAEFVQSTLSLIGQIPAAAFEAGTAVLETRDAYEQVFRTGREEIDRFLEGYANLAGFTTREGEEILAMLGGIAQGNEIVGTSGRAAFEQIQGLYDEAGQQVDLIGEASADFSQLVLRLAGDITSLKNADPTDTLNRVRSGILGEIEPLRKFGIELDATSVKQKAFELTGKSSEKQLTSNDKILARLVLAYEKAGVAIGNLNLTRDAEANVARRLSAIYGEAKDQLAVSLVPAYGLLLDVLDRVADGSDDALAALVRFVGTGVFEVVNGTLRLAQAGGDLIEVLGGLLNTTSLVADGLDLGLVKVFEDLASEVDYVAGLIDSVGDAWLKTQGLFYEFLEFTERFRPRVTNGSEIDTEAGLERVQRQLRERQQARAERDKDRTDSAASTERRREQLQQLLDGVSEAAGNLEDTLKELLSGGTDTGSARTDAQEKAGRAAIERLNKLQRDLAVEAVDDEHARRLARIEERFRVERDRIRQLIDAAVEGGQFSGAEGDSLFDALTGEGSDLEVSRLRAIEVENQKAAESQAQRLARIGEQEAQAFEATLRRMAEEDRAREEAVQTDYQRRQEQIDDAAQHEREAAERSYQREQERVTESIQDETERQANEQRALAEHQAELARIEADRINATRDLEREAAEEQKRLYQERVQSIRRYTDAAVDAFVDALDQRQGLSEAEIEFEQSEFGRRERELDESYNRRELSAEEHQRRLRELSIQRQAFEERVREEEANAFQRTTAALVDTGRAAAIEIVKQQIAQAMAGAVKTSFLGIPFPASLLAAAAAIAAAETLSRTILSGFSGGGYTGQGDRYEVAGVVHRGEYVFEKPIVERDRRGFADLHALMRTGLRPSELLAMAGLSSFATGGEVVPYLVPAPRVSVQGGSDSAQRREMAGLRQDVQQLTRVLMRREPVPVVVDRRTSGDIVRTGTEYLDGKR